MPWRYFSIMMGTERSVYRLWIAKAPTSAVVRIRGIFRFLRYLPKEKWTNPHYGSLSGFDALGELRPKDWRLIGWFGPQDDCFTILTIINKEEGKHRFQAACRTAEERRDDIEKERRQTHEILPEEFEV